MKKHLNYLISTHNFIPDFLLKETERIFPNDTAVLVCWVFKGTYKGKNDLPPTGSKIVEIFSLKANNFVDAKAMRVMKL